MDSAVASMVSDLLSFIQASPTPWHAVKETSRRLNQAGYRQFDEREPWSLEAGSFGFVVRGGGTLAAFRMGDRPPAEAGYVILAAHTDSPGLRLKPRPEIRSAAQLALGVEVYGGPLFHSWLDRDLSLSGRVALCGGRSELVQLERVARIPSLAIHLDRGVNTDGLKLNPQTQLRPLLGLLSGNLGTIDVGGEALELTQILAAALPRGIDSKILGYELCFHDSQHPELIGARSELISAPRLDNLASCHAVLSALLRASPRDATQVAVIYDHEEVGSGSAQGAESQFLLSLLQRLAIPRDGRTFEDSTARALARSFMVSADMAHAVHPNFSEKHDDPLSVLLGAGPVVKVNASQRYATDALSQAVFVEACQAESIRPQVFVSRSDMACGSTIGPISAARTGIRTVDVGNPMLSMHSARELGAVADVLPMIRVLTRVLSEAEAPSPSE